MAACCRRDEKAENRPICANRTQMKMLTMSRRLRLEKRIRKFFEDNGLSIVLILLFIGALAGQIATGFFVFNQQQSEHRAAPLSLGKFLASGTFTNGIFSNWQAATLQLAALLILSTRLRQRGASHSRSSANRTRKPGHQKKPKSGWLYRNSLSLAFCGLFAISFLLHLFEGARAYNEKQRLIQSPTVGVIQFAASAEFWFENTETWQAEFFTIAAFIILTIFLRQENSPESKPSDSPDNETGTVDS